MYPTDPVNKLDLSGMVQHGMRIDGVASTPRAMTAQGTAQAAVVIRQSGIPALRRVMGATSLVLATTAAFLEIQALQAAKAGIPGLAAFAAYESWSDVASYTATAIDCTLGATSGPSIGQGMMNSPNCVAGLVGIGLELFLPTGGGIVQGGARVSAVVLDVYTQASRASTATDWVGVIIGAGSG